MAHYVVARTYHFNTPDIDFDPVALDAEFEPNLDDFPASADFYYVGDDGVKSCCSMSGWDHDATCAFDPDDEDYEEDEEY